MRLVLLLVALFFVPGTFAASVHSTLTCDSKMGFVTAGKGKFHTYSAGNYNFPLKQVASLTVLENNRELVRFYPLPSMTSVVLNKSYNVKTDEKSYWKFFGPHQELKISCVVKIL